MPDDERQADEGDAEPVDVAQTILRFIDELRASFEAAPLTAWQRAVIEQMYAVYAPPPVAEPARVAEPVYLCRHCHGITRHPDDVANRYCPWCRVFDEQNPLWFSDSGMRADLVVVDEAVTYVDRWAARAMWNPGRPSGSGFELVHITFNNIDVAPDAMRLMFPAPLFVPLPWAGERDRFALLCATCGPDHRGWSNGYRGTLGWTGLLHRGPLAPMATWALRDRQRGDMGWHAEGNHVLPYQVLDLRGDHDGHQLALRDWQGKSWGWHLLALLTLHQAERHTVPHSGPGTLSPFVRDSAAWGGA